MGKKFVVFIFLLTVSAVFSQQKSLTANDVLKKAESAMNKQEYVTVNMSYNLFLDYDTKSAYEQYKGFFVKMGKSNYIKIKSTEFVTFDDEKGLKINHDEKAIQFSTNKNTDVNQSPLDLTNYLRAFPTRTLTSNNAYYICELKPNKISQIMFSKVVIYIKKSDYSIDKQLFYFVEKMESKNDQGKTLYTVPRLEITYSPRKKDAKKDSGLIRKGNYFTETKTDIKLVKRLSAYKLIKS